MARPLALATGVALATSVVWAVLSAVFNFHLGLLVVAAFGGWIIGSTLQPAGPHRRIVAVVVAAATWLVASIIDFTLSQTSLPDAATPLGARLSADRYLDYTAATFDVISAAAIAILVVVAWRSAR